MSDQLTQVDLNTASKDELMTLPGIGPAMAERILAARPFTLPSDLINVSGIGEEVYNNLQDRVTVTQIVAASESPKETFTEPADQAIEVEDMPVVEEEPAEEFPEEVVVEAVDIHEPETEENVPTEPVVEDAAEEFIPVEHEPDLQAEKAEASEEGEEVLEGESAPAEGVLEAEPVEAEATQEEENLMSSEEIPGTVGIFPTSPEAEDSFQAPPTEEDSTIIGTPPETPPEPQLEVEQTEQPEKEPPPAPLPEAEPQPRPQPKVVTRSEALWMAVGSGIIAFFLAIAFTLGLLVVVNGGLQYVNPASFNALQTQVSGLNNQAASLQQDISGLRTRVDNLEGLSGRVDTLEQNNKQLRSDLDSTTTQLQKLDQQVSSLAGEVSTLTSDVNDLKTSVGVFQQFINGLRDLLNGLGQ